MLSASLDCVNMLQVKVMSPDDFAFAIRLTDEMNWDMTEQDFELITTLEPEGCLVLLSNSKKIGISTAISYGRIGWFGNLIVEKPYRNKGAGSLLVNHSIHYLKSKKVETIGLYSYLNTVPFYERLGFRQHSNFSVLKGEATSRPVYTNVREVTAQDVQSIIDYDTLCFGDNRGKLLRPLLVSPQNISYVSVEHRRIIGYLVAKVYDDTAELGPLICQQGRSETAINLLNAMLGSLDDCEVSICVSNVKSSVVSALKKLRFREDFPVTRMFFGPPVDSMCVYVAESLERG